MPLPALISTGLGLLLKESPTLIRMGEKILDQFRDRRQFPRTQDTANREEIQALQAQVEHLHQRLEVQESNTEAQAELIVQLTRHNASLVRWLIYIVVGLALSGGVAIVALILTLLT